MKNKILQGDSLQTLRRLGDNTVDCIITSPPYYGLRDYGVEGQIGLEPNLKEYIEKMLAVTFELKRVLKPEGTLWWNHGDSYAHKAPMGNQGKNGGRADRRFTPHGHGANNEQPEKSLLLQAHRLAIRMIDEQGWILRNQIIWHKPNVMPTSAKDRFTVDFEPVFFFTKNKKYYFSPQKEPVSDISLKRAEYGFKSKKANINGVAVEKMGNRFVNPEGRNKRTVWRIPTSGSKEAHIAMFPERLIEPMILAGCPQGGVVLDPFLGSGTVAAAAKRLGRSYIGIELNGDYIKIAEKKISRME